ncbi:MAG: bifunctional DNA-formamidopyrimidine glycosylase/DNA-(apurinic or apyrimidinic site) lyase [bacterium]
MPELPEVETIKNGLGHRIVSKTIQNIEILNEKSFIGSKKFVVDQQVIGVNRRAKVLQIELKNQESLLFHLKMTGQLIYLDHNTRLAGGHPSHDWHAVLPNKHTRIIYTFNDQSKLYFNDLRKFGWCKVLNENDIASEFRKYGPEPFSSSFNAKYLFDKASGRTSITVKQFLMDQSVVAGIGNIYNDETLFLSWVNPKVKANKVTLKEWQLIVTNAQKVLKNGIKHGGTTDSDYVDAEGKAGGMQDYLNVYHRTGQKCPNDCGNIIKRTKIGGRGTYFCPKCQKEVK